MDWEHSGSRDTTPDATAKQFEVLRRIGPAGRAAMTFELGDNLRSLVRAGVRHRHPHWDDRTVEREVIRLMIGDALFRQAYEKVVSPEDIILSKLEWMNRRESEVLYSDAFGVAVTQWVTWTWNTFARGQDSLALITCWLVF